MRHTITSDKWYTPIDYDGIDLAAWRKREPVSGPSTYFLTDFTPPPLLPGAEDFGFLLGQLSRRQYAQQAELQISCENGVIRNAAWLEYVCRHAIKDIKGLEIQDASGVITPLTLDFEESSSGGKCLTLAAYESLLPFGVMTLQWVALAVRGMSQAR